MKPIFWTIVNFTSALAATFAAGDAVAHDGLHGHGIAPAARHPVPAGDRRVARGTVFEDRNRNGRRDARERGVGGVSVSNGIEVTRTRPNGSYELALPPESILFVSKPAGYELPVDADNLPQFYYIHYPDGTPNPGGFEYPVIAPTGPLPDRIDFALYPGRFEHRYEALAFADPQAGNDEELDMLREDLITELIDNTNALFGVVAGDVVNDDLSLYPRHNRIMGAIGIPIFNVPGNHDINYDAPNDRYATETFKRYFGPTYYSFNYGKVHFLMLDNVEYKGQGQGRYDHTSYRGYISDEQLTWLANDLRHVDKDSLIVIVTHISLLTFALDGSGGRYVQGDNINTVNLDQLLDVLRGHEHVYAIAGHDTSNSWQVYIDHEHNWQGPYPIHAQTLIEARHGWDGPRDERGVRTGHMQDGSPNGYYILSFDGNRYSTRFKAASQDPDYQMRIVLDPDPTGPFTDVDGNIVYRLNRCEVTAPTSLVVNVFDGGEKHLVEMSLDASDYAPMENVLRTDPHMEKLFSQYQGTDDRFARPEPASHIWQSSLPDDLQPGLHVARVRVTDPYGQVFEANRTFETY